jgi:hypothetical protein
MVGGVDKVTLSDDTAARRGTQKTVQERIGDPPFDCVVEIHAFDEVAVHLSTADAVDALLADRQVQPELRRVIDGVVRVLIPGRIEPEKLPHTNLKWLSIGQRSKKSGSTNKKPVPQ